ncbi:MAG: sn-glycerol-3-phosphate ABC transporter ATP-binding protein UgpC [Gemmatimonadota bacterium]|nr:sn-glycerol-3-phosphate ABC transporter ATP-binding protein UgpC [Gemmatimonadota bacterium]
MASVTLKGVKKVYQQGGKDVTAVHGVDLEVKDGELVVLVGPSGCGKSTTLRMVAGLESISAGELFIDDRKVNDVPANDRDVAMVFQSYALYPHMSAYDNMAFALKLRGMSKADIDARVKEAASILGIGELLGRRPKDMSGGQRQRVAVGRAIVRHPRVFLFDEPLSNLDAKLRVQTRREIARLHQQLSATMLYVTHDQVEAMTLGDRIVVLEGGHVMQIDTPMNLYERPRNTFVAAFIGSPSMNLLPGAIVAGPGGVGVEFHAADDSFSIALGGEWAQRLAGFGGRSVIMGVRPEDIEIAPDGSLPLGESTVRVRLDVVEPLGSEAFLSARIGAKEITARVPPRGLPAAGSEVELVFTRERLHFFDAGSGETLRSQWSADPHHEKT